MTVIEIVDWGTPAILIVTPATFRAQGACPITSLTHPLSNPHHGAAGNIGLAQMISDGPERIIRLQAVLDRTGLARSTLYRKVEAGSFPKQVQISARCVGWRESAVNEWLRNPMCYTVADRLEAYDV